MKSRKHLQADQSTNIYPPPLCASEDYYRRFNPQYPRNKVLSMGRWLLSHFSLDAVGLAGLIYILVQDFITNFINEGPDMLSTKQLDHWFAWQIITHYPLIIAGAFTFLLLLIPVGFWMRSDERKEKETIERRWEGLLLANGYRAYLEYVVTKTGSLPRLLQYDHQTVTSLQRDAIIFTPLRLAQTRLSAVQRMPLDGHRRDKAGKKGNLEDGYKAAGAFDITPSPPVLVVDRAIDALAHSHNGAIIVLGQPGSGKTTLLRHLILEQAQIQLSATKPMGSVPIFLDLAMPDVTSREFKAAIEAEVESVAGVDKAISARIVDAILRGPSIIVVDGLDELLGNIRKSVRERLEMLTHSITTARGSYYNKQVSVQIAVSSRVSNFRKGDLSSQKFETWELLPLTDRESQRVLVTQVLRVQPITAAPVNIPLNPDQLLNRLEKFPQTAGWVTNPLLLTLATIDWAHSGGNRVARTRVALYRNAVEELMKQRMKDWSSQELAEAAWLAEDAALELFQQGRRSLTMQDFTEWIMPHLSSSLADRKWGPEQLRPGDVFLDWSGLFVLDSSGRYDIYHLTFLEYLAARALARKLVKEWPSTFVVPTAFLDKLHTHGLQEDGDLSLEMKPQGREVLALLWLKRKMARWWPVLMMMTGVLNEYVDTDKLMGSFHRPDLAFAWIRALLDQPDDVGLLSLRLAAGCVAEIATTRWNARMFVQEIKDLLVIRLCKAALDEREGLKHALQNACTMLAGVEIGQEAICDSLVTLLTDPDERIRETAAEALGALGAAGRTAFPKLIAQLTDSDQHVRKAVAEAINKIAATGEDAIHHLVSHLNTPDPDVRVALVRAIGTLGQYGASALDHLCTMLADGNENTAVCQAVVETIGSIGLVGTHNLEILYDRLADDNVNIVVRVSIVEAIGRIGFIEEDVLQILVARLTDSDWRIRAAVIQAIGKLGFNAIPALDLICTRLTDKNENTVVRQAVAWAIGTLGSLGAPTLDVLSTIIADENDNPAVRQAVAWAIGTFGLYGAPALESLSASLANENEKVAVRREIAEAIGKIGIAEVYVLPYLVPLLSDSNPEVRAAVVQAIGTLEHAGVPALEALSASLANQDENLAVRQAVAEAIGKVGTADVDVLPYLVPLLSDANPEVRAAVVQAIGTLGLDGVPALFNLSTFLNDSDMNVRERVALVIGRFGRQAEHALPALVAQLNDHEEDVRVAVEWAIKSILATGISVKPSILDRLGSPEWQVRRVAAGIVKAFGPKAAALLPQLEKQLANPDKSAIVREKVAQAIGALRIAISSPLPNLLNWLSDPEWRVREAMKRSIRELAEAGVAVVEQLSQLLVDPNVNGEMRLAVVEVIEALVSTKREVSLGLYELLPKRGELLVHFDSWHIQQAIEQAGRAPQQIQDISKSMEISHQLIDSHGIILKAEDEADIVQQFGDVDWQVRELALRKIGDQKELMESSESLLMEALADSEPIVSDSAAIALATMYPDILNEKLLKDLTKAFEGHPQGIFLPFAQRNELNLYLTLGSEAHPFLDSVVELLDAEHWSVREGAVRVLGALRHISSATVSVLMRLYKEDRSPAVRQAVEEALEAILSLDDTFDPGTNQEVE